MHTHTHLKLMRTTGFMNRMSRAWLLSAHLEAAPLKLREIRSSGPDKTWPLIST
jgi:hypothetical protein